MHTSPWLKKMPQAAAVRGRVEVAAVRHDDVRRLAAAFEGDALHVRLARVAQEELADLGRAREGDHVDVHVPADRLAGRLAAGPARTWRTPSGMPASEASSARRIAVSGDCSAGFRTTLLPVASAGPTFQDAISSGKFHGTTAATTPSGSRRIMTTFEWSVGATSS